MDCQSSDGSASSLSVRSQVPARGCLFGHPLHRINFLPNIRSDSIYSGTWIFCFFPTWGVTNIHIKCLNFFFNFWLCWVFVAARGAFSSWGKQGLVFAAACGLLSLLQSMGSRACRLQWLPHTGSVDAAPRLQGRVSVVVAYGLSCSLTCAILLDRGLNPCFLHWQAPCSPLSWQGSPVLRASVQ